MDSEILTLSQDEIENIKKELCRILGYRCKDKIEVINEVNIDDFGFAHDKKKHKNLFIISNKEENLLDLEIDLKKMSSLADMDYQIKFEGYTIKFTDFLSEEKIKIGQKLYFNHCDFKAIELKNISFENFEIDGYRDKSDQKKPIVFRACEFKELSLNNSIFSESIKFEEETKIKYLHVNLSEFKKYFFMQNCIIEKINLWKNKFKNRCYFIDSKFGYKDNQKKLNFWENICKKLCCLKDSNFEYKDEDNTTKLNFSNTHFEDEVYFNNSEFYNYADFHECKFDNIACFYGVKFYKAPNFSACYFKEQKAVNLINVDIDELNFESVEKYIEDNYQDESYENKIKGMQNEKEIFKIQNKHKLRYAKNLKDSFRVIKDILITQNNTLEAQEWHKLELYAKEKENHINLSVKDREKNADISKNILIWFNCVLLNVYRNTSDHHNDFLKILNFTVGMIVLYGVFIFFCQACIEPYSKFFNELKSSVIFIIIGILVFLCCIMFYFNRKKSIFAKSIFFIIAMVFIVLYLVTYFYKTNEYKIILYLVMCYILSIYICYFFFNIKNIIFNIVFKFMLYLVFLFFLINSSQFINPFTGVFSSGKLYESQFEKSLNDLNTSAIINLASISQNDFNLHLKDQNISFTELNSAKALIVANKENLLKLNDVNSNIAKEVLGEEYTHTINQDKIIENTIKSTSVLYGIILLLCIFSLQKTARKNSIVPS